MKPNLAIVGRDAHGAQSLAPASAEDAAPPASIGVSVTKVTNECFSSVVRATGYVIPRTSAVIMFNAPGFRIAEVAVKEGDWIKAGDQVAVVSATSSQPLPGPGIPNGEKAAPTRIAIKSLATGLVLNRNIEIGMPTSATGGPLVTLAVDGEMEALVDVPSVHVLELSSGQTAHVSMDDGREFGGHVRLVPVEINKVTQVGQARLSIDSEQRLSVGRFVRVTIDARRSCGIGVPLAALTHESDGLRLQVVRNGIIETRMVTLGLLGDTDAEIVKGLAEGDLVVSDAGTSLRDGDKVRPIVPDFQDLQ